MTLQVNYIQAPNVSVHFSRNGLKNGGCSFYYELKNESKFSLIRGIASIYVQSFRNLTANLPDLIEI